MLRDVHDSKDMNPISQRLPTPGAHGREQRGLITDRNPLIHLQEV